MATAEFSKFVDRQRRSMAERSYPSLKFRCGGREELPHVQGVVAARAQDGREELLHIQGQEGWPSLIQGKEQWLCFAGAAVRRYPMFKGRETQVRW